MRLSKDQESSTEEAAFILGADPQLRQMLGILSPVPRSEEAGSKEVLQPRTSTKGATRSPKWSARATSPPDPGQRLMVGRMAADSSPTSKRYPTVVTISHNQVRRRPARLVANGAAITQIADVETIEFNGAP